MKIFSIITLLNFVFVPFFVCSQDKKTDDCLEQKEPLTPYAYRTMMRTHYNLALLGSQTPTSGFKIETNQPTITLKGNIFNSKEREWVVNLELTGGAQNDLLEIFSGDQLNGYFTGSVGINKMFASGNKARYTIKDESHLMQRVTRMTVCSQREEIAKQLDTMSVLYSLRAHLALPNKSLGDAVTSTIIMRFQPENTINNFSRPLEDTTKFYRSLILGIIKRYGADTSILLDDVRFLNFISSIDEGETKKIKPELLLSDLKRLEPFHTDRMHKYRIKDALEIETYKDIWKSKQIVWLNLSFTGSNSSFKMYDKTTQTISDGHSFLPGVSLTFNLLQQWMANRFVFFRGGVALKRFNSLPDLDEFEYSKETVISVSPNETLKSDKKGKAFQGQLSHGAGFEIPLEMYYAPWKQISIPGFYSKLKYSYGDPWINRNKLLLDIGLLWNVQNSDPESKNLLTIVPYISWRNLLKEYKEPEKVTPKKLSEVFSVGIRIGIPINVGKK